jgi:hypothetical protein
LAGVVIVRSPILIHRFALASTFRSRTDKSKTKSFSCILYEVLSEFSNFSPRSQTSTIFSTIAAGRTMNILKAPDEFVVKLYRWACADFQREMEEGFPLIKGIESPTTYCLLTLMDSLSKDKRLIFASGLLKRFHIRAVQLLGDTISAEQHGLFERLSSSFAVTNPLLRQRWDTAPKLGPTLEPKQRRKIIDRVRDELHEPYCVWPKSGPWVGTSFEVEKGGFRILTRFWPGTRVSFSYDHAILDKAKGYYWEPDTTFYCDKLSIHSWLGISWETMWMDLRAGEVERVGKDLVRLCRHFIEGVAELLDDAYLQG